MLQVIIVRIRFYSGVHRRHRHQGGWEVLRGCDACLSQCASVSDTYGICGESDGEFAFERWRPPYDARLALDADALPLLSDESEVWVRADNAYYKGEFAEYCDAQGWDYSVSVTNGNCKSPVVNIACDMDDSQWEWLNEEEQAMYSYYRPNGWERAATLCGDSASEGRSPAVAVSGVHGDTGVDRPVADFRSGVSPSRQAGSGECVQGSADRPGSSSSAVQQFCGESGILLVRLAGARIVARTTIVTINGKVPKLNT